MADRGLVLGLDTASLVTVGLADDGRFLGGAVVEDRMAHVEQLMPTINRVLDDSGASVSDIGRIVVGLGPGPFTGLRVGVVSAQILALTTGAVLHGICSLDAIAAQHAAESRPTEEFVVAADARRRELYWASYAPTGARVRGPEVGRPDDLPDLATIGPGVDLYPRLPAVPGPRRLDPAALVRHGPGLPDLGTAPLYLRRPDAVEPTRRKSVLLRRPDRSERAR